MNSDLWRAAFTFQLHNDVTNHVEIHPDRQLVIRLLEDESYWKELSCNILQEEALVNYSHPILKNRWQQGNAVLIFADNQIISYISAHPLLNQEAKIQLQKSCYNWQEAIADFFVTGAYSNWTHPDWRRRGFTYFIRKKLFEKFCFSNSFTIGATTAPDAVKLMLRQGSRVVGWKCYPFISTMAATDYQSYSSLMHKKNKTDIHRMVCQRMPFQDEELTLTNWKKSTAPSLAYLCLSSIEPAVRLNALLETAFQGEVEAWSRYWHELNAHHYQEGRLYPLIFKEKFY